MKVQKRNEEILSRIRDIKAEHPFWGYRRVWAYLKYRQNIVINHKRIYLLMKRHNLIVTPNTRLKANVQMLLIEANHVLQGLTSTGVLT